MKEWFCEKCHYVWLSKENTGCCDKSCCGTVVEFDPCIHGKLLVGSSNAWLNVFNTWDGNEFFESVADELKNDGCYGAPTIMNVWIKMLLEENKSMKKDIQWNYKKDIRGPGDGCRVCTGTLEIDNDGDLVCWYCNMVETKNFDYYEWKMFKLEREQTEALMQPCISVKKPSFLTQLKNFFRNK